MLTILLILLIVSFITFAVSWVSVLFVKDKYVTTVVITACVSVALTIAFAGTYGKLHSDAKSSTHAQSQTADN